MKEIHDMQQPAGPWGNIQTVVWLVGLAILAWHGWWWPGILVLVAVSMVTKGMVAAMAPPLATAADPALSVAPSPSPPPAPAYRPDLLPDTCVRCGGPVDGRQIRWTGTQSAACSYCGARLLLRER